MNDCERHETLLSTWLDGPLERGEQIEALDHLARCGSCRRFYAEARRLNGLIAAVRQPADAEAPPPHLWDRIERAAARRGAARVRGSRTWEWRAAAAILLAAGLGLLVWQGPFTPAPRTDGLEVRLGESAGRMTEARFFELTREVLSADGRYHTALHAILEQVMKDTTASEASDEGMVPRDEGRAADPDAAGRIPA